MENKRIKKFNKTKRCKLEKIKKNDKTLAQLTKNKKGTILKNKIFLSLECAIL